MRHSGGFTLTEVMACLLILSMGLLAAIGLILYGMHTSSTALAQATALPTAMSVAIDPSPLQSANTSWTAGPRGVGTTTGYLNGFWIQRVENDAVTIGPGVTSTAVHVDVYEKSQGDVVASFSQRLIRQAPAP